MVLIVQLCHVAFMCFVMTLHCQCPPDTWRNNNVIITSKRRRDDVIVTLLLRRASAGLFKFDACYICEANIPLIVVWDVGFNKVNACILLNALLYLVSVFVLFKGWVRGVIGRTPLHFSPWFRQSTQDAVFVQIYARSLNIALMPHERHVSNPRQLDYLF